ncbi:MAG: group 1 truncated hemoglobin [Sphingomonas fennica]
MMMIAALMLLAAAPVPPGEEAVAPYVVVDANAGARPFEGGGMAAAFGGRAGIERIVDRFVAANFTDPVIGPIFAGQDRARLTRVLKEQFCYILAAGCAYTGRDMASAHRDMGVQQKDMNRLVENLQAAMRAEGVPFAAQNRFLSRLAPMRDAIVTR